MTTVTTIISGRKDWDVVAFSDYEKDMAEATDRALAIMQEHEHEIKNLKRTIWQLVLAAGGKITIEYNHQFYDLTDIDWMVEDKPYNMSKTFTAKIKERKQ